jgi:hypothetical protein
MNTTPVVSAVIKALSTVTDHASSQVRVLCLPKSEIDADGAFEVVCPCSD